MSASEPARAASLQLLRVGLCVAAAALGSRAYYAWPAPAAALDLAGVAALALAFALAAPLEARLRRLLRWRAGRVAAGLALLVAAPLVASPRLQALPFLLGAPLPWALWRLGAYPRTPRALRALWAGVLGVGALVRLGFTLGLPWPLWSLDSVSYAAPVHAWLTGDGPLVLSDGRVPATSLWLLLVLGLTRSYAAYVAVSHLVGLVLAAWAAWRVRLRCGELAGALVLVVLALDPKLVFYEHMVQSEAPFMWGLVACAVLALETLGAEASAPSILRASGLGLAAAGAVLARQVLLPGASLLVVAALARGWSRGRVAALAAGLALPILGAVLYNQHTHGFTGLTRAAPPNLFGVAGHLLDVDSPGEEEIKREMAPALAAHGRENPWWNPDFNLLAWAPSGPLGGSPRLNALPPRERERVIEDLALQAIRQHPVRFTLRAAFQAYLLQVCPTGFYLPHWERLGDADLVHRSGAPEGFLAPRDAARPGLYESLVAAPGYALGVAPFLVLEQPLTILLLLAVAWRARDRVLLLWLGLAAASLVGVTSVMAVGTLERYHLQPLPLVLLACARLAGTWTDAARTSIR